MFAGEYRLWRMPSLLLCTIVIASGTAQDKAGPVAKPGSSDKSALRARVIEGYGAKIEIVELPNLEYELIDGNSRSRYRTDATTLDRKLTTLGSPIADALVPFMVTH